MRWFQMGHLASEGTDVATGKPEGPSLQQVTAETMTWFPALLEKSCPHTPGPGGSYSDSAPTRSSAGFGCLHHLSAGWELAK